MDKNELKELLKENLKICVNMDKSDGAVTADISVLFDNELICEATGEAQIEASYYDRDWA